MPVRRTAATLVGIALLSGACAGTDGDAGDPGRPSPPSRPDEIVVQITIDGGLAPIGALAGRFPSFTLTGDGLAITEGPQIEIYPPPALPNLLEQRVTDEGVAAVLGLASDAGLLGPDRSWDAGGKMADATTTTFTVTADGRTHTVSAYALGYGEQGLGAEEEQARARLTAFQGAMFDLARSLPEGTVGEQRPYEPPAIALFVHPYDQVADPSLQQRDVAWPLSTALATFGDATDGGLRCGVVRGADLEILEPELRTATTLTPWVDESGTFALTLRPMLPSETACPGTTPA